MKPWCLPTLLVALAGASWATLVPAPDTSRFVVLNLPDSAYLQMDIDLAPDGLFPEFDSLIFFPHSTPSSSTGRDPVRQGA